MWTLIFIVVMSVAFSPLMAAAHGAILLVIMPIALTAVAVAGYETGRPLGSLVEQPLLDARSPWQRLAGLLMARVPLVLAVAGLVAGLPGGLVPPALAARGLTSAWLLSSALAVAACYLGARSAAWTYQVSDHLRELLFGRERWLVAATLAVVAASADPTGFWPWSPITVIVSCLMIGFAPSPLYVSRTAIAAERRLWRRVGWERRIRRIEAGLPPWGSGNGDER